MATNSGADYGGTRACEGRPNRPPLTFLYEKLQGFIDPDPNEVVIGLSRLRDPLAQSHLEEGALLGVVGVPAGLAILACILTAEIAGGALVRTLGGMSGDGYDVLVELGQLAALLVWAATL